MKSLKELHEQYKTEIKSEASELYDEKFADYLVENCDKSDLGELLLEFRNNNILDLTITNEKLKTNQLPLYSDMVVKDNKQDFYQFKDKLLEYVRITPATVHKELNKHKGWIALYVDHVKSHFFKSAVSSTPQPKIEFLSSYQKCTNSDALNIYPVISPKLTRITHFSHAEVSREVEVKILINAVRDVQSLIKDNQFDSELLNKSREFENLKSDYKNLFHGS
ncbi:hypothetical protein HJ157_22190 [Vibrio parahaemolyticus]|nr:hypothetical protein [Vibrio parahaemolyticus]MBE4318694.1 hypothetical protein [Vibrio parahaemolyticus]